MPPTNTIAWTRAPYGRYTAGAFLPSGNITSVAREADVATGVRHSIPHFFRSTINDYGQESDASAARHVEVAARQMRARGSEPELVAFLSECIGLAVAIEGADLRRVAMAHLMPIIMAVTWESCQFRGVGRSPATSPLRSHYQNLLHAAITVRNLREGLVRTVQTECQKDVDKGKAHDLANAYNLRGIRGAPLDPSWDQSLNELISVIERGTATPDGVDPTEASRAMRAVAGL